MSRIPIFDRGRTVLPVTGKDWMTLEIRGDDGPGLGSGAFGVSRGGGARPHRGIDIVSQPGEPVHALQGGVFVRISRPYHPEESPHLAEFTGAIIRDDDGNNHIYWYMNPVKMRAGQRINKGDVIGHTQNRARLSKGMTNHFHFEIRTPTWTSGNRTVLNPVPYLEQLGFNFR